MSMIEAALMQNMTDQQRLLFQTQLSSQRKSGTTGVLLALLLGGIGAHRFYMGQAGLGVLYALFCWTLIPSFIALIECFLMSGRVQQWNDRKATELAAQVMALGPSPVARG